jgi:hypothetical protein
MLSGFSVFVGCEAGFDTFNGMNLEIPEDIISPAGLF